MSDAVKTGGDCTVGEAVDMLAAELFGQGNPRRMANDIVAAILDVPRFWASQHLHDSVSTVVLEQFLSAARRVNRGEPFAYAVGKVGFRYLTLDVDERVLIPRPETELIIDEIFSMIGSRGRGVAVDIGTGSGAIALSLAHEGRFSRVIATDISRDALDVAAGNARSVAVSFGVQADKFGDTALEFRHGAFFSPLKGEKAEVIVSNPPYIAYDEVEALPASVRDWEPVIALISGNEGMAATARIIREAADHLQPDGVLALEVDVRRAALVAELAATDDRYHEVSVRFDLTGRERFVLARRRI